MYKNGGREINLIYVNNSKGLREQKQYKWTKKKESAGGLYTALLSVKQCSIEGSKWQRFWKTPWYHPTLKNKWHCFGTPVPTYISSGGAKKETRQPADPGCSSDLARQRPKSMPTLPSGLKMQRNTLPNRCTEQTSHKQWGTILNEFSSKCLAHPKEKEQMKLVIKYNKIKKRQSSEATHCHRALPTTLLRQLKS